MTFSMYWDDSYMIGTADQIEHFIQSEGQERHCYIGLSHWGFCSLLGPSYEDEED